MDILSVYTVGTIWSFPPPPVLECLFNKLGGILKACSEL